MTSFSARSALLALPIMMSSTVIEAKPLRIEMVPLPPAAMPLPAPTGAQEAMVRQMSAPTDSGWWAAWTRWFSFERDVLPVSIPAAGTAPAPTPVVAVEQPIVVSAAVAVPVSASEEVAPVPESMPRYESSLLSEEGRAISEQMARRAAEAKAAAEEPVVAAPLVISAEPAPQPVAAPVTAPVAAERVWTLSMREPIDVQLHDWAREAGWTLDWQGGVSWMVPAPVSFEGSFESAIGRVISALYSEGHQVILTLWAGNKFAEVVHVDAK